MGDLVRQPSDWLHTAKPASEGGAGPHSRPRLVHLGSLVRISQAGKNGAQGGVMSSAAVVGNFRRPAARDSYIKSAGSSS